MIAIIDYGLGNIAAFANIYKRLNVPFVVAKSVDDVCRSKKLILPGVGAFDFAITRLAESGLRDILDEVVRSRKVHVLGVCVGMQMLGSGSQEGRLRGLGWIDGEVRRFDDANLHKYERLPHMGWNDVRPVCASPLFAGLVEDARFYFLHSYYFRCVRDENILAETEYAGGAFACAVGANNVYGVQFHPEKSHHYGVQLLKNFAGLTDA